MASFIVTSTAFAEGDRIPARYAHDHQDLSPPLSWSEPPTGTEELVLTCLDPDSPGGTFVHWLVAGIEPGTSRCEEGKPPIGSIEGRNDYGQVGYGGPQPPVGHGPHRYAFTLYALSRPIDLRDGFDRADLAAAMEGCVIGSTQITGTYERT